MAAPAGFREPAIDAARAFRAVLDAMARPGRVHALGGLVAPPEGLSPAAAAVLLTLSDADAPVWLAPALRRGETADFLRFHTGAAPVADPGAAAFVVGPWAALRALEGLPLGSPEYPDRSATLVVETTALTEGAGVRLRGPGVAGEARLRVEGVDDSFRAALALNRRRFPCGFDVILTAGERVAALPRTTDVEA